MNIKILKITFLYSNIFVIISFISVFIINNRFNFNNKYNKPSNFEELRSLNLVNNEVNSTNPSNSIKNFDSILIKKRENYRNPEWEQLNRYTFFRRSSAIYFIDEAFIRILFVTHATIKNNNYSVELFIYQNHKNVSFRSDCKIKLLNQQFPYALEYLQIENLNLSNIITNYDDSFMEIIIIDETNQTSTIKTRDPIRVKLRYARDKIRTGSIICSSCFFYFRDNMNHSSSYFYKTFQWWFELNKQIGYNKIVIYNTSIPNRQDYNDLFYKYKDFVEVIDLKYLPNFYYTNQYTYKDDEHEYLNGFEKMNVPTYALFQILVINDCYLNNKHLYDYISVLDQDETIVPRANDYLLKNIDNYNLIKNLNMEKINNKFELNQKLNLESSCSNRKNEYKSIDKYMKNLSKNFQNDLSITFPMSYLLSFESVELIFDEFESYFKPNNYSLGNNSNIMIKLKDSNYNNYTYNFKFDNQDDIDYVKNMIKLYKILIKEFFISKKNILNRYSNEFNRYVYLGGIITYHRCGKTIHNTNFSLQMGPHYPMDSHIEQISYDLGTSSHFRIGYNFLVNATIPIRELILDLNYIYCYYRPVLKHLSSLDIITD